MIRPLSRYLTSVILLLVVGGCSLMPPDKSGMLAPVTHAGTDYQQALREHGEDPAVIGLYRNRLIELAITLARHRQQQGNWYAAQQTLRHALDYLPEQPRLKNALKEVEAGRLEQLQYHRDRDLVAKATYELARQASLEEQERLKQTDYLHRWKLDRNEKRLKSLAQQLRNCAIRNLEHDHLQLAGRCIDLAENIEGRDFIADVRQTLKDRIAPVVAESPETSPPPRPKPRKAKHNNDNAKETRLREQLTEAMNAGDLVKARDITRELIDLNGETPQLLDLQNSLDTAIRTQIESLHELANEHYREQRYEQAKAVWLEVLKLDPDDSQAKTLIERADRVIKKIESLQQEEDQQMQ